MHTRLLLTAAVALSLTGCIQNMAELKSTLGAEDAVEAPLAPAAKATASDATAKVGEIVRFTAAPSSDPRALPLEYAWHFGDGIGASGVEAEHAYLVAGSYAVTLTVRNSAGLADVDLVRIDVAALDLPPVAGAAALPARAWIGQPVSFSPSGSYDPEGAPIRWVWDFGDGETAASAEPTHAFATAGLHEVALTVLDAAGQETRSTIVVPVSLAENRTGLVDATSSRAEVPVRVPASPARLSLTLAFDGAPANDLGLEVRDGDGHLVDVTTPGGAQLVQGRVVLDLASPEGAPGDWSVSVVRHAGVRVPWTLSIVLAYG